MEFNPDGSLKLSGNLRKEDPKKKLETERCVFVHKDLVYERAPKKCRLHITFSKSMPATLENTFTETPVEIKHIDEKEYQVEVGSSFRRCQECNLFVKKLGEKAQGNIIEEKGTCTYKGRTQSFSYEDYFE